MVRNYNVYPGDWDFRAIKPPWFMAGWSYHDQERARKEGWIIVYDRLTTELFIYNWTRKDQSPGRDRRGEAFEWVGSRADQGSEFHARAIRIVMRSVMESWHGGCLDKNTVL